MDRIGKDSFENDGKSKLTKDYKMCPFFVDTLQKLPEFSDSEFKTFVDDLSGSGNGNTKNWSEEFLNQAGPQDLTAQTGVDLNDINVICECQDHVESQVEGLHV